MNIPLLLRLREAGGAYVQPAALGPDPAAVRRDLDALEAFGFALEHHPYLGVAYRGPAARLCPDQIEHVLGTRRVGRRVAVWDRVASTNDLAARAAGSAANEGLVVLAESQTAGRGRRGRSWSAPPGCSILMSVLLFPEGPTADPSWLTALGAVAVAEVAEAWSAGPARIKWPNDVRVGGRKLAGILVERGPGAVLGIGLNVNLDRHDFPPELRDAATSIQIERGGPVDRSEVVRDLIRRLDRWYQVGRSGDPDALADAWRGRSEHPGRPVRLRTAGGELDGVVLEVDLRRGFRLREPGSADRWLAPTEVIELMASRPSGPG